MRYRNIYRPPHQGREALAIIQKILSGELKQSDVAERCAEMERKYPGKGWNELAVEALRRARRARQ